LKKLIITIKEDGMIKEIEIKNADDLACQVSTENGIIEFGQTVGVNIDSLISYQFVDIDNEKKNGLGNTTIDSFPRNNELLRSIKELADKLQI